MDKWQFWAGTLLLAEHTLAELKEPTPVTIEPATIYVIICRNAHTGAEQPLAVGFTNRQAAQDFADDCNKDNSAGTYRVEEKAK